jgi:hypothetical protein
MASYPRWKLPKYYRRMPENYKTEIGRKTKGPQRMATNKSPTRQTMIQQNSERTETPITHSQK